MQDHFFDYLCRDLKNSLLSSANSNIPEDGLALKDLCFYSYPEKTMNQLIQFAHALEAGRKVKIEDAICLDISPYLVMDAIVHAYGQNNCDIEIPSPSTTKAIKGLHYECLLSDNTLNDLTDTWPFPVSFGRAQRRDKSDDNYVANDQTVDAFINTLEVWLDKHGFSMAERFAAKMERSLHELIENSNYAFDAKNDNADTASGNDWALVGYMARRERCANGSSSDENDGEDYICYISMLTLGKTVFESLSEASSISVKNYLDKYNEHADKDPKLSVECLTTAAATHGGISSRIAGGNGLTKFLHSFSKAAAPDTDRHSIVISGSSHVHFFGPYSPEERGPDGSIRQPFNEINQIYSPPDINHVFTAQHQFPGTIVSARFRLDKAYLQKKYGPTAA